MSTESLWGNIDGFKRIKTPLSIVREQGDLLTQETQGILQGYVKVDSQGRDIQFSLFIIATRLNQYKYQVLQIVHGIKIYPVDVYSSIEEKWTVCKDETSFLATIKSILSSSETRK